MNCQYKILRNGYGPISAMQTELTVLGNFIIVLYIQSSAINQQKWLFNKIFNISLSTDF